MNILDKRWRELKNFKNKWKFIEDKLTFAIEIMKNLSNVLKMR